MWKGGIGEGGYFDSLGSCLRWLRIAPRFPPDREEFHFHFWVNCVVDIAVLYPAFGVFWVVLAFRQRIICAHPNTTMVVENDGRSR